jgi:hypothetical protein
MRHHTTFTADVTYDHEDKIANKYFTADLEIMYHPKVWTRRCLSAICFKLKKQMSANEFKKYVEEHHFDHYVYDKNGFGCRTWTTRVATQLKSDEFIEGEIGQLIATEKTRLLAYKKEVTKKVRGKAKRQRVQKKQVSIYEVPDESGRFFTYNSETKKATIIEP